MSKKLIAIAAIVAVMLVAVFAAGCTTTTTTTPVADTTTDQTLLVYAGMGLKAPMQEIGTAFTQKYGANVEFVWGGSGTLIPQMKTSQTGDAFIPGGEPEYKKASTQGLVEEDYQLVAYHIPVIAVPKGNAANIQTVQDLTNPGLRLAIGDASAIAIGTAADKILEKAGIDKSSLNIVAKGSTVNELITALTTGNADAGIITRDGALKNTDKLDIIEIPTADNFILRTPIGVTTFTTQKDLAQKFVDFTASDEGKAIFEKHGFPKYPNSAYEA